jgi:hypothetical protein
MSAAMKSRAMHGAGRPERTPLGWSALDTTWVVRPRADTTFFLIDTVPVITTRPDSAETRVQWPTTSLRTRLQWIRGRLALDLTLGGTASSFVGNTRSAFDDSGTLASSAPTRRNGVRLWGRADARIALTSFMEATGGIASLPANDFAALSPRRVGTLGFAINGIPRVSRAPDAVNPAGRRKNAATRESFESVRDEAGTVRLRVRLPNASNVELSSELTGWTAVPMQKAAGDWWELPVRSPAGVYRVNIRVDGGAWKAPPNTSTVRDEFGGQVGLVKIG